MSREIKFRGLTISEAGWVYGTPTIYRSGRAGIFDMESAYYIDPKTLTQFTGLHDKNGKEIYEGDIVQLNDLVCPITWDDGGYQMITSSNQGKSSAIQERLRRFQVIGNIYEHPHLL
jgi:uncharacterized phage protein (TIGR01671 family)